MDSQAQMLAGKRRRALEVPRVVAAERGLDLGGTLAGARAPSHDVDGAAGRAAAVEHRAAAWKNLDALDRGERDRGPFDRAGVDIVEALAVDQHRGIEVSR